MHQLLLDLPQQLESDRLYLRCYEHGDGRVYFSMLQKNREHLSNAAGSRLLALKNEEETEIYLRELINDWALRKRFVLGAWDKTSKIFVGEIWIEANNWDDRVFEIGWFAEKECVGKGYMTEAVGRSLQFIFEVLDAHKVVVTTSASNVRSYSLAERCGFTREGCLRQHKKLPGGVWGDTLYYGLLRKEYKSQG